MYFSSNFSSEHTGGTHSTFCKLPDIICEDSEMVCSQNVNIFFICLTIKYMNAAEVDIAPASGKIIKNVKYGSRTQVNVYA